MNTTADKFITSIDPRAAREAAQWLMRLHSGKHSEADQEACEAWRKSDPAHELAWQRAEMVSKTLGMVPASVGMPVLDRPALLERRATIKTLAMLIAASPIVWATYRAAPWHEWAAGVKTAKGEIRHMTLGDGSKIVLNTDTAIDIAFDEHTRLIKLHSGEIHIETAVDPAHLPRPFVVQSENGRVRAIGTRFTVRHDAALLESRTHVAVTQGKVEIRALNNYTAYLLDAGQKTDFDDDRVAPFTRLKTGTDGWINGVLIANDMPLGEVVTQLGRYRSGILRCHPSIENMRITGAFQLKDTDSILALLQKSLPIKIQKRTRFWVSLEPA
ncbi:MAG: FecR domain-containing protein [Oxalicibacterium faecigallinarum]|uniref:FecR domain-containing protein n=1 Tax=Oxalicibacterium faecigallinarum TaxID=573741 RepID=UPI0028083523|nr:FecR domain-containing protein [Oxalicibacterium faecigallinarum]MDQ7970048.1 FecR domain-containing protein [Oxalicibacterium faecigallinarum]